MIYVVTLTQVVLCTVSMLLTGLFAMSLAGVSLSGGIEGINRGTPTTEVQALLSALLLILIGICIDVSKLLFWSASSRSRYYAMISVALLLFSWFASVSYFVSAESDSLARMQQRSPEYQQLSARIDAINNELLVNKKLVQKRLSSQFHRQWDLAEASSEKSRALKSELADIELKRRRAGIAYAAGEVSITHTIHQVAELLDVPQPVIRAMSFGLLALLLEVCTLASISLAASYRSEIRRRPPILAEPVIPVLPEQDAEAERKSRLTSDICTGKIPPVIRQIRAAQYGLGVVAIKAVLQELMQAGVLEKGPRNSYRIRKRSQDE